MERVSTLKKKCTLVEIYTPFQPENQKSECSIWELLIKPIRGAHRSILCPFEKRWVHGHRHNYKNFSCQYEKQSTHLFYLR